MTFQGRLYAKGEDGYEGARQEAIWNGRKPARYPDLILVAETEQDVIEAVKLANRENHRIGIRSGGHSFTATGIRDGGILIDLSKFTQIEVDPSTRTAWIGPAVRSQEFCRQLDRYQLTYPYGGCPTVGLGGFMLSGGYGLNGKSLGSAASNIRAFEMIDANGEKLQVDAERNSDYLWAARGGGYGFFGVITRFQVQLYDAPAMITQSTISFDVDASFSDLATWFFGMGSDFDPALLTFLFGHKNPEQPDQNLVSIFATTFTDTREEADRILAPLGDAPVAESALFTEVGKETTLHETWDNIDPLYPKGHRYQSDTTWITDPTGDGFVEAVKPAFATLPSRGSHILVNPWIPGDLPDGALSGTTSLPFHIYAVYEDPADDDRMQAWIQERVRDLLPFSNGIGKVNDSDLLVRDHPVLGEESERRLEELRARYDPDRRFHSFLRPD